MDVQYLQLCFFLLCIATSEGRRSFLMGRDTTSVVIDVKKIEVCNSSWNHIRLFNFKSNIANKVDRSIDIEGFMDVSAQKITNLVVKAQSCKEAISFNTCETFGNFRFGDKACEMLRDQNAFWTPLVKAVTPEFRCPFKANTYYKMRNGTVNTELIKMLGVRLHDIFWILSLSIANEEGKNFGCANIEVKATTVILGKN